MRCEESLVNSGLNKVTHESLVIRYNFNQEFKTSKFNFKQLHVAGKSSNVHIVMNETYHINSVW